MYYLFILMFSTSLFSSGPMEYEEENKGTPSKITHIYFGPSPFGFDEITARLYLPGDNYVEATFWREGCVVPLDNPIDTSAKTASYFTGEPYHWIVPGNAGSEERDNGLCVGAIHAFYIPGEGRGGPCEKPISGRLWPEGSQAKSATATLFLKIEYSEDSGKYSLVGAFQP